MRKKHLLPIAQFISQLHEHNIQVVLVSSGSVAAGYHLFKDDTTPDLITKKAMAPVYSRRQLITHRVYLVL